MTSPLSDLPPQVSAHEESPHKPADDREEVYFHGSPMLRGELGRVIGFTVVAVLVVAIPFLYRYLSKEQAWPPIWVTIACIVVGIIISLIPFIMTRTYRYRISNYRIDFERGLFTKKIDTLELWHVEDIKFEQGLLDRMMNVGSITVMSNDRTNPKLELHGIPDPRKIFDALKERVIAVKRQRGVLKIDEGAAHHHAGS